MAKSRYPGISSYDLPTKGRMWECRYEAVAQDGIRRQKRKRGFRTEDEALRYQHEHSPRFGNKPRELVTSHTPLGDYLAQWIANMNDVSPNTLRNYRNRLAPISVQIGHIPLNRLSPSDLDDAYRIMRRQKQSASAVKYGHRVLKQALKRAVILEMINTNPCDRVTPPRVEEHHPDFWNQDEMQQFLDREIDHPEWGDFWAVLCETWMRIGEITDLRWKDIDSKQNTISVTHAVRRNENYQDESGPVKTAHGRRTIPVNRTLIERLLLRKVRMGSPKLTALVFPSAKTEAWIKPAVARKALVAACERAEVPVIGLHEVRHSGGSIAYVALVPLKLISQRLGHANTAFTEKMYVHLRNDDHKAAAEVIWGLIAPPRVRMCQIPIGSTDETRAATG